MMRTLIVILQFLVLIFKITCNEDFELLVLHNNNIDFEFDENEDTTGGAAKALYLLSKYRKEAELGKKPPVLYFNAGDNFAKSRSFTSDKWDMVAEYLNILKPDVMCLGNHDLNVGVNLTQFLQRLTIPVVGVNIDVSRNHDLKKYIKTSHILKVKNHMIGVIGYTTSRVRIPFLPRHVLIKDEIQAVLRESSKLHHMGVKIIIALGHSGYDIDRTVARLSEHVDVIIAGHRTGSIEHVPFQNVVKRRDGKYVPIIHEPGSLKCLGMLKIKFDENGDVISFTEHAKKLHYRIPRAPEVLKLYKRFKRDDFYLPLGKSRVRLSDECSNKECNYANMVTDAICDYRTGVYHTRPNVPLWTDYPIVIINSGVIRREIRIKESLTKNDFVRSLFYDNTIVVMQIEGRHIMTALEQGTGLYGAKNSGLMQFSGIHAIFNLSETIGNRLKRCYVRCGKCPVPKYEVMKSGTTYSVIVNEYLFSGSYGITVLGRKAQERQYLNNPIGNIVEDYISTYKTVTPEESDRFIITDKSVKSSVIQPFVILFLIILRYM